MLILLALALLSGASAMAQVQPDEIRDPIFWDRGNVIIHSTNFAIQTADAFTTRHILDHHNGRERNPWARQFVAHGWAGQATYSWGLSVGGTILTSYLLHRAGHHR